MPTKQGRLLNPDAIGNQGDDATETVLLVVSNLESQHATFIQIGFAKRKALPLSPAGQNEKWKC